jgi:membrane fusion protein (multidrug efflux system)
MFAKIAIDGWEPRALLAAAVLCSGVALAAPAGDPPRGEMPAAEAPAAIVLPARVVAYQAALITAKVAGYVQRIPVDKGDRVRAGDLIAQLDVPELQADRLRYAAQADVAERNYARMLKAVKVAPDLVTPENVETQLGQVEVAKAQLARVDALLRYARVTAPFSGTVTARYVDPGAFVPVPTGSSQGAGQIVMLMSLSRVRIQIPVPESDAPKIRAGCPVTVSAADLPGVRFATSVTRVSSALSSKSQTMLAEIDMPNPDHRLLPGMYVSVSLTPGRAGGPARTAMNEARTR